jgi:hypothetical protein
VRAFFLATLSARLSLPTLSSSITRFSYGAKPATSRISSRTIFTRFPSRCGARERSARQRTAAAGQVSWQSSAKTHPLARARARGKRALAHDVALLQADGLSLRHLGCRSVDKKADFRRGAPKTARLS